MSYETVIRMTRVKDIGKFQKALSRPQDAD